jgi:hypothetical protein
MSFQVDAAFVEQYGSNVDHLVQQMDSRFAGKCRMESQKGKTKFWEQLGATTAVKRTARHADTPRVDSKHRRRQCILNDYDWSDLIDTLDDTKMLINPRSSYAQSAAYAMSRAKDEEIIEAATGTAYADTTGAGATSATALPGTQEVAVNYVLTGGATNSGLTLPKMVKAKSILGKNEVPRGTKLFMAITQQQLDDMLNNIDETTNADYAAIKALVEGEVDYFMGLNFIRTELLTLVTATDVRTCFAYAYPGLLCAVGQDYKARITERDDKNYATQVYFNMAIGATRMQEKMVVAVYCDESP